MSLSGVPADLCGSEPLQGTDMQTIEGPADQAKDGKYSNRKSG